MEKNQKPTVCMLAALLESYGVRHVVVCPGTRNAPVIIALSRRGSFDLHTIIDERSAAFIALGISRAISSPVAIVCTSGSAALNFAPALAEAFYSDTPLVAVTADRPYWWIDQYDGQTIRQAHALDTFVRCSIDLIPDGVGAPLEYVNRQINEALHAATGMRPGPVHINIQLDTPLTSFECLDTPAQCRRILFTDAVAPSHMPHIEAGSKVLLLTASNVADENLDVEPLICKGIAVAGEIHTLKQGMTAISHLEHSLDSLPAPDVLISFSGDIVSARFKRWLRSLKGVRHIAVGTEDGATDTFGYVSERVMMSPGDFCRRLAEADNIYANYAAQVKAYAQAPVADKPVLKALAHIANNFCGMIFVANGSAMRYIQYISWPQHISFSVNRGVNGIDGCTSTAMGMSMMRSDTVLLITGDMGAAYDIGALATEGIAANFKMLVLDNIGGDIFRNISATKDLPELERFFTMPPRLPLKHLAEGYGYEYFETNGNTDIIDNFLTCNTRPAILRLKLDSSENTGLI